MNKTKNAFIIALINSITWTVLVTGLGLIQFWITIGVSYIVKTKTYSLSDALQEGTLLFFIMAITTAITIDYYFAEELDIPKWANSILFMYYPLTIAIFVTVIYVLLYVINQEELDKSAIAVSQYGVIASTIAYALIAKFIMFFNLEIKK